uniref:Uncharacterized protein n=1 Tax=Megaselia scalaris TaxID=36166 RepID=T1GMI4_MEGSC
MTPMKISNKSKILVNSLTFNFNFSFNKTIDTQSKEGVEYTGFVQRLIKICGLFWGKRDYKGLKI